ncbi:MAG: alkaline phosphatase [Parvularculaceae bacterium]
MLKTILRLSASLPVFAVAAYAASAPTPQVDEADAYFKGAQATLESRRTPDINKRKAKNVILFVGDGMDPTTVAAARIFDGQSHGEDGEENFLSFEKFPHLAMSKTYNTDAQTPDSAGTISAMVTGMKTKMGVISLSDRVVVSDCASTAAAMTATLGELSEQAGMATGVISTARLTHATPAAVYSHAADREWESDTDLPENAQEGGCSDIARQLIEFPYGDGLEVAMGGGRSNFIPAETADPEGDAAATGRRRDGRDLTAEWTAKDNSHAYVWNAEQFDAIDPSSSPKVLGLFEASHMEYEADRENDKAGEPSLAEMTEKAIDILDNDKDGFFLLVEAGRIDHAHHGGNAARAMRDAQALSDAVAMAREKTSSDDTLIIVTADHGHVLTFAGYPTKGNNILGLATASFDDGHDYDDDYARAADGRKYTTLAYTNGPGTLLAGQEEKGVRHEPTEEEVADVNYRQQAAIPMRSETHGGQDVTIYADGPRAYLFSGVVEQNYIFHVIDDALSLRKRAAK